MANFPPGPLQKKFAAVTQAEFNTIADFEKYVKLGYISVFEDENGILAIGIGDDKGFRVEKTPIFKGADNRRTKWLFNLISDKKFSFLDMDKNLIIRN